MKVFLWSAIILSLTLAIAKPAHADTSAEWYAHRITEIEGAINAVDNIIPNLCAAPDKLNGYCVGLIYTAAADLLRNATWQFSGLAEIVDRLDQKGSFYQQKDTVTKNAVAKFNAEIISQMKRYLNMAQGELVRIQK